jgi:oligopeptide/dipeptide ABC transporter ATP-binding protein
MINNTIFLDIKNLTKVFARQPGIVKSSSKETKAVDDVSFKIFESESFGLVGETGSGKSTLGRCLLRLIEPDQGQMLYNNVNIAELSAADFRPYRLKLQMIFQNPGQSLNPLHTIRHTICEPLQALKLLPLAKIPDQLEQLLIDVGLDNRILDYFPHQLSGGQKQRVVIARVLAVSPSFIIADEPTSSVDASIKRQILDLINNLRSQFGLTVLIISHDLSVVSYATERTAVMFGGRLIEIATTKSLMQRPAHPYTRQLVQSAQMKLNINEQANSIPLDQLDQGYAGCKFVNDCPYAKKMCKSMRPELQQSGGDHFVACHFPDKLVSRN